MLVRRTAAGFLVGRQHRQTDHEFFINRLADLADYDRWSMIPEHTRS